MAKEYTFKKKISKEDIENIMAAVPQGIAYWADEAELKENTETLVPFEELLTNDFSIRIHDSEAEKWHTLTMKKFLKGLAMMENHDYYDYDMVAADQLIQYALFGKQVYA